MTAAMPMDARKIERELCWKPKATFESGSGDGPLYL